MGAYILVMWMTTFYGVGMIQAEFNSKEACIEAQHNYMDYVYKQSRRDGWGGYAICLAKDYVPEPPE